MTDDEQTAALARRAHQGDLAAFGDLVELHQARLRGFVALLGVEPAMIDELAQDAWVDAFHALRSFDPEQRFLPWLRGIARHRVWRHRDRLSVGARRRPLAAIEHLLVSEAAGEPHGDGDLLTHLRHCLGDLPEHARRLLDERYGQADNASRIAERQERAPTAIRMALARLRQALRRCIEQRAAIAGDER